MDFSARYRLNYRELMRNKDYLEWKYARNYQIANNKCYRCKTELVYLIKDVKIGNQEIKNARVLTGPECSKGV